MADKRLVANFFWKPVKTICEIRSHDLEKSGEGYLGGLRGRKKCWNYIINSKIIFKGCGNMKQPQTDSKNWCAVVMPSLERETGASLWGTLKRCMLLVQASKSESHTLLLGMCSDKWPLRWTVKGRLTSWIWAWVLLPVEGQIQLTWKKSQEEKLVESQRSGIS